MITRIKSKLKRILYPTPVEAKVQSKPKKVVQNGDFSSFQPILTADPLNAGKHMEFSVFCVEIKNHFLALAEYRTALFLGAEENPALLKSIIENLPQLDELDHNQFYRFRTLAEEVKLRAKNEGLESYSILDIGGGHGQLAAFLPDVNYVLCEPDVNGISGIDLPFEEKCFDFVVSCHVLEHIPPEQRHTFLNQKLSRARKGIILLNPIYVEGTYVDERMDLVIDVTDARWAKEHRDCQLPRVSEILDYAKEYDLKIEHSTKGNLSTSLAFFFAGYFSHPARRTADQVKINKFYNTKLIDQQDSKDYPGFGLFFISK